MMGCKNCWKRGPSIDNQTRKQIWEENFLVRQNLKGAQQSEHFWAFQMTSEDCNCTIQRYPPRKFGSLQALDKIDCSPHCGFHIEQDARLPSVCQVHQITNAPVARCRRDAATETLPSREDKSVGPGRRVQMATAPTPSCYGVPNAFKTCSRYKPPDWGRNEGNATKQQRQQSLSRLRKNEEVLQQMMQKPKRGPGNWGTEYTRSFKNAQTLGSNPRCSRSGPVVPAHSGGCDTPMPGHMSGMVTPSQWKGRGMDTPSCDSHFGG